MADSDVERVRESLHRAREGADRDVRLDIESVEQGFEELVGGEESPESTGDSTRETVPHDDRLGELVDKLAGLRDEAEGDTASRIESARSALEAYRERHRTQQ